MAHIVYSGAAQPAGGRSGIFAGIKFWLSQKVPQRSRFVDDVKVIGSLDFGSFGHVLTKPSLMAATYALLRSTQT